MPYYVDACQVLGEQTYHIDVARGKQLHQKASLFPRQTNWLVVTHLLDIILVPNDVDGRQRDLLFVDVGQVPISDKSSSKEDGKLQRRCALQLQTHCFDMNGRYVCLLRRLTARPIAFGQTF